MGECVSKVRRIRIVTPIFFAWTLTFHVASAIGQESQTGPPPSTAAASQSTSSSSAAAAAPLDVEEGKRLFVQNCSVCHGVNGGGEEGPDLHGVSAQFGAPELQGIIRRGIPGTAMPGSATMSERQVANVAAFVIKLGSATASEKAPGDPASGEAIYKSSGCPTCHMIAGRGGSIGPELTRVGAMRGAANLKARLQDPGTNLPKMQENPFGSSWTQYLMFRAVDKDGRVVEGMRVGEEDSFTIVLKDAGGKFHALRKPDLRSLEKEPGKSIMPTFKGTLSDAQMNDLVAYLMTLKSPQ